MAEQYQAVVIGTSAGGMNAIKKIIDRLPIEFAPPILIVQHVQEEGTDGYRTVFFNKKSLLPVKEALDKEPIQSGTIYLAPAAYHMLVEQNGTISLSVDPPVNYSRPSIDVLFESAAVAYGKKLIGIILTGANDDGSKGIQIIKDFGGHTIAQDPDEAESDLMPRAAIRDAEIDQILSLEKISDFLTKIGTNNKPTEPNTINT